jgi:hypothetical protein
MGQGKGEQGSLRQGVLPTAIPTPCFGDIGNSVSLSRRKIGVNHHTSESWPAESECQNRGVEMIMSMQVHDYEVLTQDGSTLTGFAGRL